MAHGGRSSLRQLHALAEWMRSSEQDVPAEEIERGEPFAAALNPDMRRTSSDLGLQVSDKLV
jgi:hypothetical protein